MSNNIKHSNLRNENWLRRMADLEDEHASVSVGGLASELGMLKTTGIGLAGVFGRFVEFARRIEHLSLETLADRLSVDLSELVSLETVVYQPK